MNEFKSFGAWAYDPDRPSHQSASFQVKVTPTGATISESLFSSLKKTLSPVRGLVYLATNNRNARVFFDRVFVVRGGLPVESLPLYSARTFQEERKGAVKLA